MDYEIMMNGTVRIGQHAPDFEATTSMGARCLNDYKGKWLVLFSHPRRLYPRIVLQFGEIRKMLDIASKIKCSNIVKNCRGRRPRRPVTKKII